MIKSINEDPNQDPDHPIPGYLCGHEELLSKPPLVLI